MKKREEIKEENKWDIDAIFPSLEEWGNEFDRIKGEKTSPHWPFLDSFQNKLSHPESLKNFLEGYFELSRRLEKLYIYAHLFMDQDMANEVAKKAFGIISCLLMDFQTEMSWVDVEILALDEAAFSELIQAPCLQEYVHYLQKIYRLKPHTLSAAEEKILARASKPSQTSVKAFSSLQNVDLRFEDVKDEKGNLHELSHGSYLLYMRSPDRSLRKSAFTHLHTSFLHHENTFADLLNGQMETHRFYAESKKFPTCLDAALYPHHIDPSVYFSLLQAVKENLPHLHRYISFRKKKLGLEKHYFYDIYAPLTKTHFSKSYEEAKDLVIRSTKPLGEEYQRVLQKGLNEKRWVDSFESKGKRSGAYSSGSYDTYPYILMNYHGNLNDVLTLAHEAGHSMHSYLSHKNNPYQYGDYPIFLAEIASTFNEQLLFDALMNDASSEEEKNFLLNYQMDGMVSTFFRQVMFADFELQIHSIVEQNQPLTPDLLKRIYGSLVKEYYGPDMEVDETISIEWARIPHFYYNYYVYQYATGISAAIYFHRLIKKEKTALDKYLSLLKSGGADYPLSLLKKAGADMESYDAIDACMEHFQSLLDRISEM